MSTPEEIMAEAQRLAAITLIPGKTYDADVMDKIKLAKLCLWQQARIQQLEEGMENIIYNTTTQSPSSFNQMKDGCMAAAELAEEAMSDIIPFPLSE